MRIGNGGMPKETQRLVRAVERCDGWTVRWTGKNHVLFCSPSGERRSVAGTPSSPRTHRRLVSWLRGEGVKV